MKWLPALFRFVVCIVYVPVCCIAVQSYEPQLADPILEPWRWHEVRELDGLGVLCMDEGADGTLWFGGTGCIASYDGLKVTRIPFNEKLLAKIVHQKEIPWAKALLMQESGDPLILIGESVVRWTGSDWQVVIQDVGLSVFTAKLTQSPDGAAWLMVPGGLWRISRDLQETTLVMKSENSSILESFCFDFSGNVWLAERARDRTVKLIQIPLEKGLPKGISREYAVPSENNGIVSSIVAGRDGLIWYSDGGRESGLESFNPATGQWNVDESQGARGGVNSLVNGADGSIWGGTEGGVLHVTPEGDPRFYPRGTLALPLVPFSLYEARNKKLWLIGRIGHVYSVDLGTSEWMTLDGLSFQCETPDGKEWFNLVETDVVSHDPRTGEWLLYTPEDQLIEQVYSLTASSDGRVWAAGRHQDDAAIAVFDGERWERHTHPEFARWIEPRAAFEASDGTLWFGAGGRMLSEGSGFGGALQYTVDAAGHAQLLKHYAFPEFPYYVTAFAQTPDDLLWIGSTVIHQLDEITSSARALSELGGENTVSMKLDHQDALWIAKEHYGVCRWQNGVWDVFAMEDGLASLLLSDLLVLRDGSLLASSDRGISRFDGMTWTPEAYSQWFAMGKRWSSMRQSEDDSIWLNFSDDELGSPLLKQGGNDRYCAVRHRPETNAPNTRIVDYLKKVAQPGNSLVTWAAHDPWGKTSKEELQYSWRLDGGAWSAFSHATGETFLNLDHGRHVLEVRARDRAFNIDPTPDRINFKVIAPLWIQPWFIGMVLLFLLGTGAFIRLLIYFREKQLRLLQQHLIEMDQLKTGFFTNISHELRTPLTVIRGPLERLLRTETDADKKMDLTVALRNANRVSTLVSQMLDFRRLEMGKLKIEAAEGDIAECLQDVVESLLPVAKANQVDCRFRGPEGMIGWFDADKLKKIAYNLINNAIKYTAAGGHVNVVLRKSDATLLLEVEDTGTGIEPEYLDRVFERFYRIPEKAIVDGSGIGLHLAKELVDLWGGTIRAESPIHDDTERPGTRFVVELSIDQAGTPTHGKNDE